MNGNGTLTLKRIEDRVQELRGQADDMEAEQMYASAGELRDRADEMEDEVKDALYNEQPWGAHA